MPAAYHPCPTCPGTVPAGSLCHRCHSDELRVTVEPLTRLRPHPVAKKLRVAVCRGHQIVVPDQYEEGVLGAYLPPDAILPDAMVEEMGLKGKLAGPRRNRVQAKELAGVLSDGLFYGAERFERTAGDGRLYLPAALWQKSWKAGQEVGGALKVVFEETRPSKRLAFSEPPVYYQSTLS